MREWCTQCARRAVGEPGNGEIKWDMSAGGETGSDTPQAGNTTSTDAARHSAMKTPQRNSRWQDASKAAARWSWHAHAVGKLVDSLPHSSRSVNSPQSL